ncbi:multiple sugar transport system permease protein [Rhodoferax ferrireducens]|uniref:Multiple sugar transport system permease protein n=1 Tax=Rhodoferax ferrireducens TaxID=192843 RepID=A0ABU2C2S9_9BURK|nr:sugar ABC transporter permease [Rhodoferax ferrireducens]MDR7375629.1 multiple sugar transport system permease protein [Rhodoferax ferrireducens]
MSTVDEKTSRARRGQSRAAWRRDLVGYAFLMPWLIGFVCFSLGPVLASLYLSFTKFDLLRPAQWIGADNYVRMFTADARFWQSLKVTFSYMLMEVPLKLAFALLVAVVLDKAIRGGALYRALFYIPSLLGGSVAIAVLWRQLFEGNGTLNQILLWLFNYKGPSWIANPDTAIYTLVLLAVWQFGSPMIIFLAGLRQIPQDLYEAASMDGAGTWRKFRKITLPLLAPVIFFNMVLQIIEGFKAFTPAYVVSGGTGGPIDSTLFYTLYLYQEAFSYFRMGYASALAWVLLLIIGAFTGISFLTSKYWVYYEDDPR